MMVSPVYKSREDRWIDRSASLILETALEWWGPLLMARGIYGDLVMILRILW